MAPQHGEIGHIIEFAQKQHVDEFEGLLAIESAVGPLVTI
jgi:hypothetical protein